MSNACDCKPKNMMLLLYVVLGAILIDGCSNHKSETVIYVKMAQGEVVIEEESVSLSTLEQKLISITNERTNSGIAMDELTVDLSVDPETRRGDIADVEMILRKVNLRRITFRQVDK